jgi:hypothetical protein
VPREKKVKATHHELRVLGAADVTYQHYLRFVSGMRGANRDLAFNSIVQTSKHRPLDKAAIVVKGPKHARKERKQLGSKEESPL